MAVFAFSVLAQTETTKIIRGAVIDKNGNPLPGAVIKAEGGAETTVAENDGSFELEVPIWLKKVSASYGGYEKKTMKAKVDGDVIFELSEAKPSGYFINVVIGMCLDKDFSEPVGHIGIKGGYLGNWGWYAEYGCAFYYYNDKVLVGAIRRLSKTSFAYLGVGYSQVRDWVEHDGDAIAFDGGIHFLVTKHFNFSIGMTLVSGWGLYNYNPKISIGYAF